MAGRRFHFRVGPTLATAVMLVLMIGLGTWQVQRLHWKENLIQTINERIHTAPIDVATVEGDADYRPAKVSGLFQHDHTLYLLALSKTGEGGYHILTPLELDDGRSLLVDRGWVPYDHKDNFFRPIGPVILTGVLRLPEHSWVQPHNDPPQNNWYGIDLIAMAKATNVPAFLPYVLELDATPNMGGYPLGGQTRVTLPNNHFGYALTWYGLALILLIIFGVSSYRKDSAD